MQLDTNTFDLKSFLCREFLLEGRVITHLEHQPSCSVCYFKTLQFKLCLLKNRCLLHLLVFTAMLMPQGVF